MRFFVHLIIFLFLVQHVSADERSLLYGAWGTKKQCAGTPIKTGGTVLAAPFVISDQWMQHGKLWCKINWHPIDKRENGIFTGALAQCGEDSVRGYTIGFDLRDNELTIRWDFPHKNGPLMKCPNS